MIHNLEERNNKSHMTRHSGTEHLEAFKNHSKYLDFATLEKHSNKHLLKWTLIKRSSLWYCKERVAGLAQKQLKSFQRKKTCKEKNCMKIDSQDNSVSSSIEYVKSWKERWLKGSVLAQWYFNESVLIN